MTGGTETRLMSQRLLPKLTQSRGAWSITPTGISQCVGCHTYELVDHKNEMHVKLKYYFSTPYTSQPESLEPNFFSGVPITQRGQYNRYSMSVCSPLT